MVKDYAGLIEKDRGDKPPIQFKLFKHINHDITILRGINNIVASGVTPYIQRPRITLDKDGVMLFGEKQTPVNVYNVNFQKWAMMGGACDPAKGWSWKLTMNANKWRRLEKRVIMDVGVFGAMEEGTIFKIKALRDVAFEARLQDYLSREFEGLSFKEFTFIVITKTQKQIKFMVDSYHTGHNSRAFFIFNGSKRERNAQHLITATKLDLHLYIDVEFLRI